MASAAPKPGRKAAASTPPRGADEGLSAEARALRARLLAEFVIEDAAGLALLQSAMESLDAVRAAEVVIAKHGLVVLDRWGQVRPNPAVAAERSARQAYLRALKLLGLEAEPAPKIGRPPAR
jgi:phage terminase small subunit